MDKNIQNQKGFTLVELLLSLTIFGIISIGIMNFFSQAYTFTNSNQKKTVAVNVARNALMYMEKENFIRIREEFEKNSTSEYSLYICSTQREDGTETSYYQIYKKNEQPSDSCRPIQLNNIEYDVTIQYNPDADYDKTTDRAYFVPLKITVKWTIDSEESSTELEGVIKSEDIR